MGVAQSELQVVTLRGHTVTGTNDFQLLLVAGGNADNQVLNQGTSQTVQRARQALVVRTRYNDLVFVQSHGDGGSYLVGELALRALNGDQVAIDLNLNAGGNRDGETSNT